MMINEYPVLLMKSCLVIVLHKQISFRKRQKSIFISDSLDSSRSLSRSATSLSSLSCNTTPFSSQDKLILSSSSSSADTNPILSSLPYTEQIYLDHCSPSNETFSPNLPVSFPRSHNNLFLNEFHQNILVHSCRTLSSLIDNVSQQQFIRIHRRTKPLLIEHKQFHCVQLQ